MKSCLEMEKKALLGVKESLIDPAGRLSSWVGRDCCTWEGVKCSTKTGHVLSLNLKNPRGQCCNASFSGNISHSLVDLTQLLHLDLSMNDFQGIRLPPFLGSMKSLKSLILRGAGFVGPVPWQLGNLTNLNHLRLHSQIPSSGKQLALEVDDVRWLSRLSSLRQLELDGVNMSRVGETWVRVLNQLHSLSLLSLSSCSLQSIPPSLTTPAFPSLVYLDLSKNHFNSTMPSWLCNVTTLKVLRLGGNRFHGHVPEIIGQLRNLMILDLSDNSLNGLIPQSLIQMRSLKKLFLNKNQFAGPVPSGLGQLSQLVQVDISDNSLQGILTETHFSNLTHLQKFFSRRNHLDVKLCSHWIPPFQLKYLGMSGCNLGPYFPAWIRTQKNLRYLNLRHTGISGTIPDWFKEITSRLHLLRLSDNRISGEIPRSLNFNTYSTVYLSNNQLGGPFPFSSFNFGSLDLSNNNFSGPIPQDIGETFPDPKYLSLSGNFFNGSIPTSLGRWQKLLVLDLSKNQLTGNIPTSLGNCSALKALDLGSNYLSGEIPESVRLLKSLHSLHLDKNSLSGEFPSLFDSHNLTVLDLGENELSGNIPSWVGESLTLLIILRLRSNKFNGSIPSQLSSRNSLQLLDLANNSLSGAIPPSFSNFTSMAKTQKSIHDLGLSDAVYHAASRYMEMISVIAKGIELEYTSTLSLLTAVDISDNHLSGEIPESLTMLAGLIVLNLSRNQLTGNIPWHIGDFRRLESLDVSNNKLDGTIPPSIGALLYLAVLNVSNNNLSGQIPTGPQIQTLTDPSIYAGNPFLCGFPLQITCNGATPPVSPDIEESEDSSWFYASIGFGYLSGILGFFTVLTIRRVWMDAYLQFLDRFIEKVDGIGSMVFVKLFCRRRNYGC
ncbi:hypothetical protein ACLOJK_003268 [Asimina triloba]